MDRRIVLIRHGPSSHTESPGWIDAAGVHRWREAYDAAGIRADSAPPQPLVALASTAGCVITSDMARAAASAERLAPDRVVRVSPLLRETVLEIPGWVRARWPLAVWEACIYMHWLLEERRGEIASRAELERAGRAVEMLDRAARETESVVAVTHGAFRRLLAMQLVATGWDAEPRVGGFRNWSAWGFRSR